MLKNDRKEKHTAPPPSHLEVQKTTATTTPSAALSLYLSKLVQNQILYPFNVMHAVSLMQ